MGKIALEFPFSIERPIGDLEGFGFGFQFVQTDGELLSFFPSKFTRGSCKPFILSIER